MEVDFQSLRTPRFDYASQEVIPPHRIKQMASCAIHYGLDFGLVARFLGGEYTGASRDITGKLSEIAPYVAPDDLHQIQRVFYQGCPSELVFEESRENKITLLRRGNQRSVSDHPKIANKKMNKEERYSHVAPFPSWLARFAWMAHHVPQRMIIKEVKNPWLVWDRTTKRRASDVMMNDITPTHKEAPITFGSMKIDHMVRLYNLRITYP